MLSRANCSNSVGYYSQSLVLRQQNRSIRDGIVIGVHHRKAPSRRCLAEHIQSTYSTGHSRLVDHILYFPARPPSHKYGRGIEMKNRPRILEYRGTTVTSSNNRLQHHMSAPRGQSLGYKIRSLYGS